MKEPFSRMTYTQDLRQYDGKIIECTFQKGKWRFLRERTDKSYPNAKGMLNLYIFNIVLKCLLGFFFLETAFGK